MKHTIEKRFSRTILAASIAAIGLSAPLAAKAEEPADATRNLTTPDSQIEVGAGYVSDDSFKFGDYGRELGRSGTHLFGNVEINRRGDNASYLEVSGRNLGSGSNMNIGIKGGEQGNFGLRFEYDELSKLHSDSYQTPYSGMGTTYLTAPVGWAGTIDTTPGAPINPPVGATIVNTTMMTDLAANMKSFNVETKRIATSFGVTKQLVAGWDVAVNYKSEDKNGTKLTGAVMQIGGGGSRGTLLAAEPINYKTDLFDVLARYAGEKLQMQFGYHVSQFDNANRALVFDNLFYNSASTVGGNALTGRLGQMPSNQAQQLSASGGYTLGNETRLSGNMSLGRMTQNEAFLPYSTQGNMPATASLNGKIDTTHADLKLHSKLTHALALTAGYKYDDRDNRTPQNWYTYNTADVTTAPGAANTRRNTPLSSTKQALYADLDYELSKATKLKLGYDYDKIKHTFEPTGGDHESTVKAEVKHSFGDTASAGVAYAHSDRDADTYYGAGALMGSYTSVYLAGLCVTGNTFSYNGELTNCTGAAGVVATTPFLDTPSLGKYFLSDRKRDKLRAFANMSPSEKLDLQLGASYYNEKYPDIENGFGLTKATGWSANFDANLAATDKVSGTFFATLEDYRTDQNGHNGSAGGTPIATTILDRQNNTALFAARTGVVTRDDRSLTMGLGFKVKPGGNYEWGGDFTHASTIGETRFSHVGATIAATVLPVPDAVTRLNRLELFGKYQVQKDVALNVKYAYEKYSSTDWAWDGQTLTSSASFIGSGQTSADYKIHVVCASLTYSFK